MYQKRKLFSHMVALFCSLALFCSGCTFDFSEDTVNKVSKNQSAQETSAAFEEYLDELFASEMSESDTISIHFSMEHPENYGVEVPEVTWGTVEASDYRETKQQLSSFLKELENFDYDKLSEEQQIIYDTLEAFIENELNGCKYSDFAEIFSPMSGLQTQIPLILSEYDFNTRDDIEDYLTLLEQSYDYIEDCLEYEEARAKKGYFLTDTSAEDVKEQCLVFLAPTENCLIPVFNEKIAAFEELSQEEITAYQKRHKEAIEDYLIPAYQLIITKLSELEGTRTDDLGLSSYSDGKKYYEYLVRAYTGSDKSVDELIDITEDRLYANIVHMQSLASENPDLYSALDVYEYPYTEPEEILEHLKECITEDFPEIAYDSYTLKYVPKSLEDLSNPAFYMIPPIDNMEKEVIYINNSDEYAHMDLFPTLAHEGFPGHLYQCTYFNSLNPHPVRSLLGPTGYHEGWAQYVENYSFQYSGLDSSIAAFLALNTSFSYGLYSRIDMGIHYEGWDVSDTQNYCYRFGVDYDTAEEVFYDLIDEPAAYLPYYISYVEIMELREAAQEALGDDFSLKDFHEFFLTVGPTYFDVIEKHMEEQLLQ